MQEKLVIILDHNNVPNMAVERTFHGVDPHKAAEDTFFRYFRHPHIQGNSICDKCSQYIHHHAFVENGGTGLCICPGETVYTRTDNAMIYSRRHVTNFYTVVEIDDGSLKIEDRNAKLLGLRDRFVDDYNRARQNLKAIDKIISAPPGVPPQESPSIELGKPEMAPDREALRYLKKPRPFRQ